MSKILCRVKQSKITYSLATLLFHLHSPAQIILSSKMNIKCGGKQGNSVQAMINHEEANLHLQSSVQLDSVSSQRAESWEKDFIVNLKEGSCCSLCGCGYN